MSTSTPNLSFRKPNLTDFVQVDSDIVDNFKKIDKYIAFYLCTSTTRPTPYEGLKILETDTGLPYIYLTGVGWYQMGGGQIVETPSGDPAKGIKATKTDSTSAPTISTTETILTGLTTTFTAVNKRRYLIEITLGNLQLSSTNGAARTHGIINLRWAAGTTISTSSTLVTPTPYLLSAGKTSTFFYGEITPNINGQVTVGLGIYKLSGSGTVSLGTESRQTIIRDVGPA